MNILITSAGRRVSLVKSFQKELKACFSSGNVYTADLKPELSSACQVSDGYFIVPKVSDPNYCEELIRISLNSNVKIIIPTIDTELLVLSRNINLFHQNQIFPVISATNIIETFRDKRLTHLFFDTIRLPRACDVDMESPYFPIFAKPFNGSCSIGIQKINNIDELNIAKLNSNLMFLEYINPNEHVEYTIDLYYDKNSILKCIVPRERIEVRGGEVSKGVTRKDFVYDLVFNYFNKNYGFIGCITLQLFVNKVTRKFYGIEVNPRFGGGYPLSYKAGANFPRMIIDEYIFNKEIKFYDDWVENLLMLRYDEEVLVYDYKS